MLISISGNGAGAGSLSAEAVLRRDYLPDDSGASSCKRRSMEKTILVQTAPTGGGN